MSKIVKQCLRANQISESFGRCLVGSVLLRPRELQKKWMKTACGRACCLPKRLYGPIPKIFLFKFYDLIKNQSYTGLHNLIWPEGIFGHMVTSIIVAKV